MDPTEEIEDVPIRRPDIPAALLLSDEARWNQTADDWGIFIDSGECHGLRAGGRLIASAAILPYGGGFGWISMVLVTSEWRRRGLASKLMNRCIAAMRARNCASLLDATPEGALVYRQLGFQSCCGMARWRGVGLGGEKPSHTAASRADVLAADLAAFGGDRRFLIENFLDRQGTSLVGDSQNFALIRQGRRAAQIGPLAARTPQDGRKVIEAALATVAGPVIIDVLDSGAPLEEVLCQNGFEAFRTFERMVLDRSGLPGSVNTLMAAAGPEFG